MDGGVERDVEDKSWAGAVFAADEGYVGNTISVVVVNGSPYALTFCSIAAERQKVGNFGITVQSETQASGGTDDKGGGVVGIVVGYAAWVVDGVALAGHNPNGIVTM